MEKEMNKLAQEIYNNAKEKGFYEKPNECGTRLMLVVSELSEALEADRKNKRADLNAFDSSCVGENFDGAFERTVKDTFEDEIADAVILLFGLCAYQGIDIEKHIELKMRYNSHRPHKHSKKY